MLEQAGTIKKGSYAPRRSDAFYILKKSLFNKFAKDQKTQFFKFLEDELAGSGHVISGVVIELRSESKLNEGVNACSEAIARAEAYRGLNWDASKSKVRVSCLDYLKGLLESEKIKLTPQGRSSFMEMLTLRLNKSWTRSKDQHNNPTYTKRKNK